MKQIVKTIFSFLLSALFYKMLLFIHSTKMECLLYVRYCVSYSLCSLGMYSQIGEISG